MENNARESNQMIVATKLKESLKTLTDINESRMRYITFYAAGGLIIYFCVGSAIYHNWVSQCRKYIESGCVDMWTDCCFLFRLDGIDWMPFTFVCKLWQQVRNATLMFSYFSYI